jgi:hypothetical protein
MCVATPLGQGPGLQVGHLLSAQIRKPVSTPHPQLHFPQVESQSSEGQEAYDVPHLARESEFFHKVFCVLIVSHLLCPFIH